MGFLFDLVSPQTQNLQNTFFLNSRYGLIGPNGCGKSTLLKCLGNREVPIPEHIGKWMREKEKKRKKRKNTPRCLINLIL